MNCVTPRPGLSGFALIEALVALLLLAIAMMGAAAALVESLAGHRSALLQTQAADLAGNLAEALRSAPDAVTAAAETEAWLAAVLLQLPQARARATALPTGFDIRLQWRDGRTGTPVQLRLPLGIGALSGPGT
jgi:Tfp pilus assembly protein PilV